MSYIIKLSLCIVAATCSLAFLDVAQASDPVERASRVGVRFVDDFTDMDEVKLKPGLDGVLREVDYSPPLALFVEFK